MSLSIAVTIIVISDPYAQFLGQNILSVAFYMVARRLGRSLKFRATIDLFEAFAIFAAAAEVRTFAVGLVTIFLPAGQILIPFIDTLSIVGTILVLTKLSGKSLGAIYLGKGNLRFGLTIGGIGFSCCTLESFWVSNCYTETPTESLSYGFCSFPPSY